MSIVENKIINQGCVYLRDNQWFQFENVFKMGVAEFAKIKETTDIEIEPIRGKFVFVVVIPLDKIKLIGKILKNYFKKHNVYNGGGTDFYKRNIIELIEPYFQELKMDYRILSNEEIQCLNS